MSDFKALAEELRRVGSGRIVTGNYQAMRDAATALDSAADLLGALDAILHDPDFERAAEGGYIAGTLWEVALAAIAKATEGRTALARAIPKEG